MTEESARQDTLEPVGLGGWLVLVGIGLVFGPLRLALFLFTTFTPIFQDGAWEILTTPGSEAYHPLWGPLLIFEIMGNALFIVAGIGLAILFFQRSHRFPTWYITFVAVNLVFILGDAWLGSLVLPDLPVFDPDTARELGRALFSAIIWVPYMLKSERVKDTFVM